jgi:fatty acid desaturase
VRSGHRYLNDTVGVLSGLCFPIPYYAFKFLHLLHHKYTNDPMNDPDAFAGAGPAFTLPFRWMLMEAKQYVNYLPKLFRGERPFYESSITLVTITLYIGVVTSASRAGYGTEVLYGWILPGRLAITLLAFAFDYLPHRPHATPRSVSDYEATCVLSVCGEWTAPLTVPLLYQNYHNIHHLAPYVPFYYYASIWHATRQELVQHGTVIKPLLFGENSLLHTILMTDTPKASNEKKMW